MRGLEESVGAADVAVSYGGKHIAAAEGTQALRSRWITSGFYLIEEASAGQINHLTCVREPLPE